MRRSDDGVALDEAVLHLDGAADRVDHAAEFDEAAVAGALDNAAMVHGDGRIDEVAAQRPQSHERALLVCTGEPAVADDVRDQDRRDFPRFRHGTPSGVLQNGTIAQNAGGRRRVTIESD